MKRRYVAQSDSSENVFALSTGDLMAGLLFIFILLLMGALLQVQEKAEQDEKIVRKYDQAKTQLYIDLQAEFKDDLPVWRAVIDSTLSVRFQEPSMLFDNNQAVLKPGFKEILNDFYPRYIAILTKPEYRDNIEEIRIEGHTDSSGAYFHNMELSQNRTRAVLEYCMSLMRPEEIDWAKNYITANGLSSSHPIIRNGKEDMDLSRRVEFKVRTNAEKQLEVITEQRGMRK